MQTIIAFALAAALAYVAWRIVTRYSAATGTAWERLLATARDSATVLWQYFVVAIGAAIANLGAAAELLNMPEVKGFLQASLQPEYVGAAFAAIAVVTIVARLRTL